MDTEDADTPPGSDADISEEELIEDATPPAQVLGVGVIPGYAFISALQLFHQTTSPSS